MLPEAVTDRCYLGPAYPDLALPAEPRPGLSAHRPAQPARTLARHLANGRIVGLFQGRLEAGPRAPVDPCLSPAARRCRAAECHGEVSRTVSPVRPDRARRGDWHVPHPPSTRAVHFPRFGRYPTDPRQDSRCQVLVGLKPDQVAMPYRPPPLYWLAGLIEFPDGEQRRAARSPAAAAWHAGTTLMRSRHPTMFSLRRDRHLVSGGGRLGVCAR